MIRAYRRLASSRTQYEGAFPAPESIPMAGVVSQHPPEI